ncbi:MAG TPA: RagB/SusD family nutrient uptake outer membrane protein [Chitinophagaceae bacterium]|nr:RagB/SusD family nutrient uptake outer membrane protein [Chitinophagaceae bacterium]
MSNNQYKKHFALTNGYIPVIVLMILIMLTTGCKKFLDVPPKDKVPQSTLFNDQQGFKDALIGVYLGMDKPTNGANYGLYTTDLSMGMLSTLAYHYDNATTATNSGGFYINVALYAYSYPTVKQEIDGIWGAMYSNIANLNNILTQIDDKKAVFTGDNFNRVKGESIALRALFHFDLARMFGKSHLTGANEKAIPYVTQFTVRPTPFSTLNAVLDSCIMDLQAAKELLGNTDTSSVLKAVDDPFTSYTQNHLNYWAVQALLARVYLYKGDFDNADKYAKAVIGSNKFPLITSNVAAATNIIRDRTFAQEHLFSVYSSNIKNYNENVFNVTTGLRLTTAGPAGKDAVYKTGSGNANDYRYNSWFEIAGSSNIPSKFYQDNNLPYELQGIVPVVRVSEMYYVAAECANNKSDINGGVSLLNNVRQARGLNALNAGGITSTDSLSTEIMREYRKEFIQEGQAWFYYKRFNKNLNQVTSTTAIIPADVYVFPIPDKEKEYNH